MRRLFSSILLIASAGACGGGPQAYIPVDSQLRAWQPPEGDAYASEPAPAAAPAAAATPAPAHEEKAAPPAKEPPKEKEKKADKR
jgi:hypothetical protein